MEKSTSKELEIHHSNKIEALVGRFTSAMNEKDAAGVAACFVSDADFTNPMGRQAKGRDAIQKLHEPLFTSIQTPGVPSFYNSILAIEEISIRFIKPDVATIDMTWTQTGVIGPDGNPWPLRRGLINVVLTESQEEWSFVVFHNSEWKSLVQ